MSPSPFLTAHQAAARHGLTTQKLAGWARRQWITRHCVGATVLYDTREIDALIHSRADRPARPPIDERALAEADAVLGIRKVGP
jgi:hypothetical protein